MFINILFLICPLLFLETKQIEIQLHRFLQYALNDNQRLVDAKIILWIPINFLLAFVYIKIETYVYEFLWLGLERGDMKFIWFKKNLKEEIKNKESDKNSSPGKN